MADIGVYTKQEILEHKIRDGNREKDVYCYWTFGTPGDIDVHKGDRFWIATKGRWQGYFEVFEVSYNGVVHEINFWSESWRPLLKMLGEIVIPSIPRKPFQGFTYKVPKMVISSDDLRQAFRIRREANK